MKVKTRRRKLPITAPLSKANGKSLTGVTGGSSASRRSSARVIRRFHVLLKRKVQLEKTLDFKTRRRSGGTQHMHAGADDDADRELREVEDEIEKMGGLEVYQRMSSIGQGKDRGGGSERVFIGWLRELGFGNVGKGKGKGKEKLRLLEVGALKPDNYVSCSSWIDVLSIDLRSAHPGIVEQDFLTMCSDSEGNGNGEKWDAISLSLVINFVPEAKDRGRMLRVAYEMLREDGLLFLALPLPCVSNSRYLTLSHLARLMEYIGFSKVQERWKEGGKMGYWLFRKEHGEKGKGDIRFEKKVVLREGKRNNFCILL